MGCRVRNTVLVKYGYYREYYECMEELNKMLSDRGMKVWRMFVPLAGQDNQMIAEVDFANLSEMEAEQDRFFSDADVMKVFRKAAEFVVEGSSHSEVLQEAMQIA